MKGVNAVKIQRIYHRWSQFKFVGLDIKSRIENLSKLKITNEKKNDTLFVLVDKQ